MANSLSTFVINDVVEENEPFFWSILALVLLVILDIMCFSYYGTTCPWPVSAFCHNVCGFNRIQSWVPLRCLAYWLPDLWFWPLFYFVWFTMFFCVAFVFFLDHDDAIFSFFASNCFKPALPFCMDRSLLFLPDANNLNI